MRKLMDTSVLINHLRGDRRAVDLLLDCARNGDELWSVVFVRTEILAGARKAEERATHRLLDRLRWQDITIAIADRAGSLARQYAKSHSGADTRGLYSGCVGTRAERRHRHAERQALSYVRRLEACISLV
jgi:predicted nucleic acid-binding protein